MAEVEAAPAAPTTAPDSLPYDDSLLIKVKGKVKKPVKPDDTERNITVQKLQAEITKYNDRIKEIKDIISYKLDGAKSITAGSSDIRQRLQALRNEFQTVLRQKQHIRDELQEVNKQREELRQESRKIRDQTKITNLEQLEAKVREVEAKISHETLTPNDEKKLHEQLQNLNQARPAARQYAVLQEKLNASEKARTEILTRLQQCDEVLNSIKAKEDAEKEVLNEVRDRHESETSDVPTLRSEQKDCWDIIVACRDKITEIRKEYDAKYQEYIKLDKNYNAYQRHQKNLKYQERKKARDEKVEEQRTVASDVYSEPYESEIFVCDRTIVYLKKFLSSADSEVKEEQKVIEAPAPGMKLFKRKGDDDVDDFFSSVAGKKGKGKKVEKPAEKKTQKLHHTIETLKTFMDLQITPVPQSTAEIPATLEKVEAKKQHFLNLRQQAKLNPPVNGDSARPAETNGDAHKEEDDEDVANEEAEKEADVVEAEEEASAEVAPEPTASNEDNVETAAGEESVDKEEEEAEEEEEEEKEEEEAEIEEEETSREKEEEQGADDEEPEAEAEDAQDVGITLTVDEGKTEVQVSLKVSEDA